MRKKIVAGNWKMNLNHEEAQKLTSEITHMFQDENIKNVLAIINPPFVHIPTVKKLVGTVENLFVGAQNCSDRSSGAYTGEISAGMLASCGVQFVILGHSERREYFKESNELLTGKVKQVLEAGLTPIFCCGEPLDIRENETHVSYVQHQLTESLFGFDENDIQKIVIAYEPIWAIGTGKTASAEQAQDMHAALRSHLAGKYGEQIASEISILYGGSCNPANAKEIFSKPDVDGGLIGGASLKSRDFMDIIKSF